ncbi:MAG: serine hydrolase domain-containing protein [Bacteroidota bacterium]
MNEIIFKYFCIVLFLSGCSVYKSDLQTAQCSGAKFDDGQRFTKAAEIKKSLDALVQRGVPGCSMAVYANDRWWTATSGLAKIEDQTPMQDCHLLYLQSVAKTYLAVAILKLYEQGKIDLDASMTRYLPQKYSRYITGGMKITVRMLLNHTSGIPEYNAVPAYITRLLQHPDHVFVPEDYLRYIEGKSLDFQPGAKYSYRNTNYLVLALIADELTGDHARFLSETIFEPLELRQTFYRNDSNYLKYPNLVNSYWDRHSDGIVENTSQLQRNNVMALVGDDGIVATPQDAVKFLKGLMEGKLLSDSSLQIMRSWVKDRQGNFTYGLGLDYASFHGQTAYGHSGGGIGAGCQLYYFPEKNIYVFVGINLGTVTDSPLHDAVSKTVDKIYEVLLK